MSDLDAFRVGLARHLFTGAVLGVPGLQRRLGRLESAWVEDRMESVSIRAPVWVTGLARSGTTILLEFLASLPGVATHQYRDFPFLHTPWWWRRFLSRAGDEEHEPRERAHGDGIRVTPKSPEAMEEVLWMSFFDGRHDPARDQILERNEVARRPAFVRFYRNHIRKLLLAAGAERYVAKANYNLTRLPFLHECFPDARFVIAVRSPEAHVASLRKQHRLFLEAAAAYPRSVAHLERVGHYEFGAGRRPIQAGDPEAVARILADWDDGAEVRGWARYWRHLYGWVAERLAEDEELAQATLLVSYETLCRQSESELRRIVEHADFGTRSDAERSTVEAAAEAFAPRLRLPHYYQFEFTDEERAMIRCETAAVQEALRDLREAA